MNVRYIGHDNMSRPGRQVVSVLDNIHHSASNVSLGLGRLGAIVAGAFGFSQGKKALIDFNSGLEQNRITMAGLWQQYKGGDFTENLTQASELVKKLQLDARASVGTTEDFVKMASALSGPIAMAGGNMENLRDMTKSAVVGSKAFGMDWQVAARDVDQALRGMYHSVDQFTGKLLTPMGYGGEAGRAKFNALSAGQRFSVLQKAMNSEALGMMAKAQETSFEGVVSTLEDTIKMTLGKLGLPLFQRITEEVKRWNDWLDKNQGLVNKVATDLGGKLVTAAEAFAKAIGFAAEHWKTILGVWVAAKSTGALNAAMSATGGIAGGASGVAGAAASTFGAKANGVAGKLAVASIVASAVYVGATELASYIDSKQSESLARGMREGHGPTSFFETYVKQGILSAVADEVGRSGLNGMGANGTTIATALDAMVKYGESKSSDEKDTQARIFTQLLKSNGISDPNAFASALGGMSGDDKLRFAKSLGMSTSGFQSDYIRGEFGTQMLADAIATKMGEMFDRKGMTDAWNALHDQLNPGSGTDVPTLPFQNKLNIPKPEKPKVNVTIHRIEVASDDPDRFVFNLGRAAAETVRNPSTSRFSNTMRDG